MSQIGAGEFRIEQGEADLASLVVDCIEATKPAAEKKAVQLDHTSPPVPACRGDSDRLAQLLDNLVSNAVKFTPEGGRVEVRLSAVNSHVMVDVMNSGSFIPPDERKRIFDRFHRASSAGKQVVPGVGLGLAISKAIVDAHGGEIRVHSDRSAGTTFQVALPV